MVGSRSRAGHLFSQVTRTLAVCEARSARPPRGGGPPCLAQSLAVAFLFPFHLFTLCRTQREGGSGPSAGRPGTSSASGRWGEGAERGGPKTLDAEVAWTELVRLPKAVWSLPDVSPRGSGASSMRL